MKDSTPVSVPRFQGHPPEGPSALAIEVRQYIREDRAIRRKKRPPASEPSGSTRERISMDPRYGTYRPWIRVDGKQIYLGSYGTREEAREARAKALADSGGRAT